MTLSGQIEKLIDAELSNRQIADKLGCSIDYARAVRNRYLKPELYNKINNDYRRRRWATDAAYRERRKEIAAASRERRRRGLT